MEIFLFRSDCRCSLCSLYIEEQNDDDSVDLHYKENLDQAKDNDEGFFWPGKFVRTIIYSIVYD